MKKVVLYGVGCEGEKFYCKYKEQYEFVYAVDKNSGRFFHNMPVYSFEEVKDDLNNYFTYVAVGSEKSWKEVRAAFEGIGLAEYKNFLSAEYANKKLAILYGNCHIYQIMRYLQANPAFSREYTVQYYFRDVGELLAANNALEMCDLFIVQDIMKNNKFGLPSVEEVTGRLSEKCICIKIPNLYGCNLFFPQLKPCSEIDFEKRRQLHANKNAIDFDRISEAGKEKVTDLLANTLMWKDVCLEGLYNAGGGINEIKDEIENGDAFTEEFIKESFDLELKKLKAREKHCDIKISDFIEENYKKTLLFYEPYHPTSKILFEKGRRILEILKIDIDESCEVSDLLDGAEVFVYGCVKRALGLEYTQKYIRKNNIRNTYRYTLCNTSLTLEEYIEEYIIWNLGK